MARAKQACAEGSNTQRMVRRAGTGRGAVTGRRFRRSHPRHLAGDRRAHGGRLADRGTWDYCSGAEMWTVCGGMWWESDARMFSDALDGWAMWPDVTSHEGKANVELFTLHELGFNFVTFHIAEKAVMYGMEKAKRSSRPGHRRERQREHRGAGARPAVRRAEHGLTPDQGPGAEAQRRVREWAFSVLFMMRAASHAECKGQIRA